MGIVCDGMGGLAYGEIASETVVLVFSEWFEEEFRYIVPTDGLAQSISRQWYYLVKKSEDAVHSYSIEKGEGMGTTLSLLLIVEGRYFALQVGDSRIYKVCAEGVQQITTDHSYVMSMVEQGLMTVDEACVSKRKNELTRCIGMGEFSEADFFQGDVSTGDSFLLSSDGFHGGLVTDRINALLLELGQMNAHNAKARVAAAIEQKKSDGEKDNLSAIFVKVGKGG